MGYTLEVGTMVRKNSYGIEVLGVKRELGFSISHRTKYGASDTFNIMKENAEMILDNKGSSIYRYNKRNILRVLLDYFSEEDKNDLEDSFHKMLFICMFSSGETFYFYII